jgi:hypothetical protein
MLRPVLGDPVTHRYFEDLETVCDSRSIASDGEGVVPHQVTRTSDDPDVYLIGPTGAEVGRFSGGPSFGVSVSPQLDGFVFSVDFPGGNNINALFFTDSRGQRRGQADATGASPFPLGGAFLFSLTDNTAIPDPLLGCDEGAEVEWVRRYDAAASAVWPDWVRITCLHRPDIDTALACTTIDGYFFTAKAQTPSGPWLARWFSPAGEEILRGYLAGLPQNGAFRSASLADGSLAIAVDGVWTYRLERDSLDLEPAPCWLAERPQTLINLIHDREGYAVRPAEASDTECNQTIEIVALDGTSCGVVTLPGKSVQCGPPALALGLDGTLSRASASVGDAGTRTCTLELWPAALGKTYPASPP